MTADPRQTQKDIDTTTDQEWFEVLAGRRPPRHGNTSEARASRGRETLSSIYAEQERTNDDLTVARESVGSVAARMERRPRRSRWIEYPAVAAVAALAGFLVGQVIEDQRKIVDPGLEISTDSVGVPNSPESWADDPKGAPRKPASIPKEFIPKGGLGGIAREEYPRVHVVRPEPGSEYADSRLLLEILTDSAVEEKGLLISFVIPSEPREALQQALSEWRLNGKPGEIVEVLLPLVEPSLD